MSILSSIPLTARVADYQQQYSPTQYNAWAGGASFFEFNGKTLYFSMDCEDDYRKAYIQCAPLKAVVNRRASMFVNGKYALFNADGDKPARGAFSKDLLTILGQPNVLQTGKQFKAQQDIYIDLFGYCPVLKVTPVGFPKSIKALWNLPPWLFDIDFTGDWYNQTDLKGIYKQFYINWGGVKRPLDMDAIFLILDNSIGTDNDGNLLMPDSRVKSLQNSVNIDIASQRSLYTLIDKKGAIGILSNAPGSGQYAPLKVGTEKEAIQRDFRRYGLTGQEWQIIITDASLNWQSMSFPTKDLMLFEAMTAAQANICDGIGMYAYLMNPKNGLGTTFANLNEAKKSQYQDFIIPDDEARTEQLGKNLIPADENLSLKTDFSHVEVLQESQQAKAVTAKAQTDVYQAQYDLGLMTRNDILEAQGKPRITGVPEMDLYAFQQTTPPPAPGTFPTQAAAI
ncbi:MAG TPA: phage portal protein [Puia sp.]|jgi:hypothetical protein